MAVIGVIFFHSFPEIFPGGFIGVDIFFVISGFLISGILYHSLENKNFSFYDFYEHRIRRIFPSLILVLFFVYVFGKFILLEPEYTQLGRHIVAGALFISNFAFLQESGYFDNAADTKPLLHLWSLGIEEQFYIIWPILLWAAYRIRWNLFLVTLVITLGSFSLNLYELTYGNDPVASFYSPLTRFWELTLGALLAYLLKSRISLSTNYIGANKFVCLCSSAGVTLLIFGMLLIRPSSFFPGYIALLPTLGTLLLLAAGMEGWVNRIFLSNIWLIRVGLISYPLYLWHWCILSFLIIFNGDKLSFGSRLIVLISSIILSILTYKFIEKPIRFNKRGNILMLILLMGSVMLMGFNMYTHSAAKDDFRYKNDFGKDYEACEIEDFKRVGLKYCLLNKNQNINSAIIGDSHAEDKFYGITQIDKKNGWILLGNPSCPPVRGIFIEADEKGCEEKFKVIINFLVLNKDIKNVVLAFYGNYFKSDPYAADHIRKGVGPQTTRMHSLEVQGSREEIYYYGLNEIIQYLINSGKNVTLLIDIPELPFFPLDCIRNPIKNCDLSRVEVLARQYELRKIIEKLKKNNPNLQIYDPIDLVCNDSKCNYKNNEVILYRDSHHLTSHGSKIYAEKFLNR